MSLTVYRFLSVLDGIGLYEASFAGPYLIVSFDYLRSQPLAHNCLAKSSLTLHQPFPAHVAHSDPTAVAVHHGPLFFVVSPFYSGNTTLSRNLSTFCTLICSPNVPFISEQKGTKVWNNFRSGKGVELTSLKSRREGFSVPRDCVEAHRGRGWNHQHSRWKNASETCS